MPKEKEKCDVCQKEWNVNDPDNWYLGKHYHGQKDDKLIWVCLDCYSTKKQEYLENYEVFYRNYFDKDGVHYEYIKRNEQDCYAGKKGPNEKILNQKDCRHCQPWKIRRQPPINQFECANCNKTIEKGETRYFGNDGKILCSVECVNIHNQNILNPKTCSECGKTIGKNQEELIYTNHEGERKIFCSSECFAKSKGQQKPQQNDPPKIPDNNQMPTGLKAFFWIAGTALIIGSIGIMLCKISKKKKKKKS